MGKPLRRLLFAFILSLGFPEADAFAVPLPSLKSLEPTKQRRRFLDRKGSKGSPGALQIDRGGRGVERRGWGSEVTISWAALSSGAISVPLASCVCGDKSHHHLDSVSTGEPSTVSVPDSVLITQHSCETSSSFVEETGSSDSDLPVLSCTLPDRDSGREPENGSEGGEGLIPAEQLRSAVRGLISRGVGVLRLSGSDLSAFEEATQRFLAEGSFRFPPVPTGFAERETRPVYPSEYRTCFNALYRNGVQVLKAVLDEYQQETGKELALPQPDFSVVPFPESDGGREEEEDLLPFEKGLREQKDYQEESDIPYARSFFNIFDYNFGTLNTHTDRCLVTLSWGHPARQVEEGVTRLWARSTPSSRGDKEGFLRERCGKSNDHFHGQGVRERENEWMDVQALVEKEAEGRGVAVFVGDALEEMTEGFVRAAPHCCRVDPHGERLEKTNENRDPGAPSEGNRLSVAMIVSQ
uniref:TauD/TfdA-like domain-containing protein n=1 Tax=Chromera velia CCMP2878 TaxID=1169474 RepID=A0A0G4HS21_9ALVE|eukprot:Cvel_8217.t1-p1 / transcript=Cvel_8217.t1 / gene=Cvel_8217 / organism=Chromera_velia_CCMP2878 / gene_product=hypothetical protein / transcript_product=hypothetical protein / location=Cvel_scaffold448:71894-74257(-) / protein_length=467 / sequence_SO=supercontig / SO=protein_coding / is_pseudo=false